MGQWPLERTTAASEDIRWYPSTGKSVRWVVSAAVGLFTFGPVLVVAGLVVRAHGSKVIVDFHPAIWLCAALGAAGWVAGIQAERGRARTRLVALVRGEIDGRDYRDGELGPVERVVGRIIARGTLPAFTGDQACVLRRLRLGIGEVGLLHEAGVDFDVRDEFGRLHSVAVGGARVLTKDPPMDVLAVEVERELPAALPLPDGTRVWLARGEALRLRGVKPQRVRYCERTLADGERVTVLGYRAALGQPLRGGSRLQLIIATVDD